MKPSDNPKFIELWTKMMKQLNQVLSASFTSEGRLLLEAELEKFQKMTDEFKEELCYK